MNNKLFTLILVTGIIFSANSFACKAPTPPKISKSNTSSKADLKTAATAVKDFLQKANVYLECAPSNRKHDRMVTKMENTSLKFNLALRRFKKQNS